MKRVLALLLVLCCLLPASACAAKPARETAFDVDALTDYIMENVTFDDTLSEIDRATVGKRYDVADDVTARVFVGSGATAEEVCVFLAPDEAGAKAVYDSLQEHIRATRDSFASYVPAEVDKIDDAVFFQKGFGVVLVITSDKGAKDTVDSFWTAGK